MANQVIPNLYRTNSRRVITLSESFATEVRLVGQEGSDVYPETHRIDMGDSWLSLAFDDGSEVSFNRDHVLFFITYPAVTE
jgi:hypothetical protein